MAKFKNKENLDRKMDEKWALMLLKHPQYNLSFLNDMHDLLDWYEHNFQALNNQPE